MESGRIYAGSDISVILQNDKLPSSSDVLESLWISNSSPSFHGDSLSCSTSMVNFEDIRGGENTTDRPFFPKLETEENGKNNTEDYDSCFHQPEKKRRLAASQVQFLEKNFEVDNKLEPERKVQLAKELGLQPRQVAIWFQNRRARFKTKQLEKDYDGLKASYDRLKDEYEGLVQERERLENEVRLLTEKLLLREKECTNSEPPHPTNPTVSEPRKQVPKMENSKNKSDYPVVSFKQEEASSAKSDVFDSDSPPLEPADSSHAFGAEQSDDDELKRTVLPPLCFPKLEDECYNDPSSNGYNWNFPVEGQPASWLWPY